MKCNQSHNHDIFRSIERKTILTRIPLDLVSLTPAWAQWNDDDSDALQCLKKENLHQNVNKMLHVVVTGLYR